MAFSTPFGLYQFVAFQFCLVGAPATNHLLGDKILPHSGYAGAYLDDIIIYSNDWQQHLQHLQSYPEILQMGGTYPKPMKYAAGCFKHGI